jgi:hypothetical protein
MYTLKSTFKRGALLSVAGAMLVAAILPASAAFADSLNPLTERSLLLSSSAPGFMDSDGAGNSESNPNAWNGGEYYALPGSGPNGKKSGETFTFKVSTDSVATNRPIQAFTLQYCTTAAGLCQAPGDNNGDQRTTNREANVDAHKLNRSDLEVNYSGSAVAGTDFQIFQGSTDVSSDWVITATNKEDNAFAPSGSNLGHLTGKKNFITLTKSDAATATTPLEPVFNDQIRLVFKASSSQYITNPGSGSFFVKINTYDSEDTADHIAGGASNIDGGVTVANVMTDSIHITTKVLETMAFSVGTQNPDTQAVQHGSCDAISSLNNNRLDLGNVNAESSLETTQAYDVYSYWRLSSNSSGGATVYYSGDTLRNTVGDFIADMPAKAHSQPGTEQFGLALVNAGADTMDNNVGRPFPANHITPNIAPLVIEAPYADGAGTISDTTIANNASFSFKQSSKAIPEKIAQNSDQVVSCATSKVRYIGNIAADTPAGVYTTKINYLAAPQY